MADTVHCKVHGDRSPAYVCHHLSGDLVGLGFNRDEPDEETPYPDAWCDDCEIIRAGHGGWNEKSEKLTRISLLCSGCYEHSRIRNTKTSITLADLATLRWKCGTCEEWHTGPCLDMGYAAPYYWRDEYGSVTDEEKRVGGTFLTENYCAINDEHFFVRGIIQLPILGSAEYFCWGVWGSLSRDNFKLVLEKDDDPARIDLRPMFSWLSTRIPEYPDTLSMKMYALVQKPGSRPLFELEPSDHPLSKEYYGGITPERVKEITLGEFGKYSKRSN